MWRWKGSGCQTPRSASFIEAPDKTKLEPLKGFAILPKGAILPGDPFASLGQHFTAEVLGTSHVAGRPTYRLKLTPKGRIPRPVYAHVDRERWNVLKMTSATPGAMPSPWRSPTNACGGGSGFPREPWRASGCLKPTRHSTRLATTRGSAWPGSEAP